VADQFLFGPDVLVAPIVTEGARERRVYLPEGAEWLDAWTGEPVQQTGWTTAAAPLERIPVYLRVGGELRTLAADGEQA
jgi:alpha-D-xyloside xylohydrolase